MPNHPVVRDLRVCNLGIKTRLNPGCVSLFHRHCERWHWACKRLRCAPDCGGRIGDMKLRGFKRTYIRRVRLIQQHGEFAEHGTRLRHPGDLNSGHFRGYHRIAWYKHRSGGHLAAIGIPREFDRMKLKGKARLLDEVIRLVGFDRNGLVILSMLRCPNSGSISLH
jgi:hypothetical protein